VLSKKFNNLSISRKLWLLTSVAVSGCLLVAAFSLYNLNHELLNDRKMAVKNVVESTHSLIEHFTKMEKTGQLTRQQAQLQAKQAIKEIRYDGGNYLWINDYQPTMIMHPIKPALNGQPLSAIKDPNGKALFNAMVSIVNDQGEGFVDYVWSRPDQETPVDKVSFVKGLSQWQWIIGSGVYLDDVRSAFMVEASKLLIIIVFIVGLLIGVSSLLVRTITRPLSIVQQVMQKIEIDGDFSIRAQINQSDEVGQMAQSLNSMLEVQQRSIESVTSVMESVASGNLNQRIEIDLKGDLNRLKDRVNNTIEQVSNILNGLSNVLQGVSHGDFDRQVQTDSKGIYQEIALAANTGIGAVSTSMNQVKLAMEQMNQGNFSIRIATPMEGDFNTLKNQVNHSLAALEQAFDEILKVSQSMAANDVSQRITGDYHGQIAQFATAMNSSLEQLSSMIVAVQQSAVDVTATTVKLTSTSEDLAVQARQQSSKLGVTNQSMGAIYKSVNKTSHEVSQAHAVVSKVEIQLESGIEVISKTVMAIDELKKASLKVSSIVEMIDGIAFQTNLLALNAAVEAARAGEHGLGFAVVANEVKGLSMRSAAASKDIQRLIQDSLEQTTDCISLVHQSANALKDVSAGMDQVTDIVSNISQASKEQVVTIKVINDNISHLENDTTKSSTMAEQSFEAASEIAAQSNGLSTLVKRFVIGETVS